MFKHKPDSKKQPSASDTWIERTSLFRHWKDMKNDVNEHKWYESERAGHDVGWHRAFTNWMLHHRDKKSDDNKKPNS